MTDKDIEVTTVNNEAEDEETKPVEVYSEKADAEAPDLDSEQIKAAALAYNNNWFFIHKTVFPISYRTYNIKRFDKSQLVSTLLLRKYFSILQKVLEKTGLI